MRYGHEEFNSEGPGVVDVVDPWTIFMFTSVV